MLSVSGLRPILVLLVWLCITLYIWVSSLKVCDSLVRQEPQKNELDYFPTDRLPEPEDGFFDDDFEAEVSICQRISAVLFLLRAIYRPHNVYCLNIDTKSSVEFLEAVRSVASVYPTCLSQYSWWRSILSAGFSRLMADINCMKDLLRHPVKWKYVINMPGQQFPLRTNLELVRILKQYNGANDIEGLTGDMLVADRYKYKHIYVKDKQTGQLQIKKVYQPNPPPPHNLEMLKGSTYGTFSRAFVEFALRDKVAKDFLEWCKLIKSPDEYFWATLHHSKNISVPGGYRGHPHSKPWLTSYSLWISNINYSCATMYIHKICILTPEDFPLLLNKTQLFANKFYITHHPAALHCLDEMIFNLTITVESVENVVEGVESVVESVVEGVESVVESVVEGVESVVESVVEGVESVESVVESVKSVVEGVESVVESVVEGVESVVESVVEGVESVIEGLKCVESVVEGVESVVEGVESVVEGFKSVVEGVESVVESVESVVESVVEGVESVVESVVEGVESAVESVVEGVESVVESVVEGVESVVEGVESVVEGVESVVESVVEGVESVVEGVKSVVESVVEGFESVVESVVEGVESVVEDVESVVESVESVVESVVDGVESVVESVESVVI
ncbi:N-acetyllactosaminide beta-1,6-N-acetylglucosaminyl-transferase [Bulinus truncatus]|nr:N-acetyllactosaminide beta-1,6-N-acetylglucosaminyl-transferase [Bulinus truncatus]